MNKINKHLVLILTVVIIALTAAFILSLIFFSFLPSPDADIFPVFPEPNLGDKNVLEECRATGCSGQICAEEEIMTTCEFLPEYTCYKTARCERQSDGQCDWKQTPELNSCLESTSVLRVQVID